MGKFGVSVDMMESSDATASSEACGRLEAVLPNMAMADLDHVQSSSAFFISDLPQSLWIISPISSKPEQNMGFQLRILGIAEAECSSRMDILRTRAPSHLSFQKTNHMHEGETWHSV